MAVWPLALNLPRKIAVGHHDPYKAAKKVKGLRFSIYILTTIVVKSSWPQKVIGTCKSMSIDRLSTSNSRIDRS